MAAVVPSGIVSLYAVSVFTRVTAPDSHAMPRWLPAPGRARVIALILSRLWVGARLLRIPDRATVAILIILVGSSVTSSFGYFRGVALAGLHQPYIEGTTNLVPRAETVAAIRHGLTTAYPTRPPQTVILLRGAQIWALMSREYRSRASGPHR